MAHKAGGGIAGKNVVAKPLLPGVGARGVNVKWPAQVGGSRGNKVMRKGQPLSGDMRATPYKGPSFKPVTLGNDLAAQVKCGPGGSRTVMASGSQHGLTSPKPRPSGTFD